MNYESIINEERKYNYEIIKQIEEHAKKYDDAIDKKEFLRNVSPYEHKIILLNSIRPYDVLSYLDELDLKNTNLIINNLTNQEILHILNLFNSEDKKKFYSRFSDLELVNRFIKLDKNAEEHVSDLTINRKVDLLNSSDKDLIEASEKIYDTIAENEKEAVLDKVSTIDGISALNTVVKESDSEIVVEDSINKKIVDKMEKIIENQIEEPKEENKEEIKAEKEENRNELLEFFKFNIKYYIEIFPVLKNVDINLIKFEEIPLEIQLKIEKDYQVCKEKEAQKEDQKENHDNIQNKHEVNKLEKFKEVREKCETQIISNIINSLSNEKEETMEKTL